MELIVLILVVVLVLVLLVVADALPTLLINAVVGLILLFLTNLFLSPPIPINLLTILICAIGGVVGWLIILILHILGIAFYVSV